MTQTILGANGAIGIELAKELSKYTPHIKLVSRNPKLVNSTDILLAADLTKKENVFKAIEGSSIVYVTIGFPYKAKAWQQHWLPFIQSVIAACLKHHSKLILFDNVYAIDKNNIHHITETSPINPPSKKGKIRAEVDRLILQSIKEDGLQAIIARSPDFFGGTARSNSFLINVVYDRLVKGKKAQWLCNADKVHSFGFVPELAKGTALLGNTDEAFNQIWNLPTSPQRMTGKKWIELFANEMNCKPTFSVMPNWLIKGLGLVSPFMKELAEMNYQYDRDYFFDSSKFNNYFNYIPTSNEDAVKQTVERLGKAE